MKSCLPTLGVRSLRAHGVITGVLLVMVGSQLPGTLPASQANNPRELRQSVREASLVVRGRVERISRQEYPEESGSKYCGTNYSVRVSEIYKGPSRQQIEFATYTSPSPFPDRGVREGDELLLLLRSHSEPVDPFLRDKPDIVPRIPSAAKIECIARLSRNRVAGPRGDGVFVLERFRGAGSESEAVWLTYMRSFTKISHCSGVDDRPYDRDCKGNDCESDTRRRVRWAAVERCVRDWTRPTQ